MKVKVSKSTLRRIIAEEAGSLLKESFSPMRSRAPRQIKSIARGGQLNEMWGNKEVMSPLVEFAQAWAGLGGAIQEQMIDVINGYIENNVEAVYEINPNALDTATERLWRPLSNLDGPDAEDVKEALGWAKAIFDKGDAEVEADARAAGDR